MKKDWPPRKILSELDAKGWSLRQLALHNGYKGSWSPALRNPYPRVERLIASALNLAPEEIWPTRYKNGQPNRRPGPPPRRPAHVA
jgi:Ner family transcriptional regulator